jgi:hypothetical protein
MWIASLGTVLVSEKIEYICHLLETVYMDWDATTGALHFISILLLMAGVESNPGPTGLEENLVTEVFVSFLLCVTFKNNINS